MVVDTLLQCRFKNPQNISQGMSLSCVTFPQMSIHLPWIHWSMSNVRFHVSHSWGKVSTTRQALITWIP